jgi:hypothetical protein
MSGKIQNEDIKSSAEIVTAGGTVAQLPNDSKIYVTGNGLNELLSSAISNGDLSRSLRTLNSQTGTSYTFVLSDGSLNGTQPLVLGSNAAPQAFTVPTNASVAFPVGTQIDVSQGGAGKLTLVAAGGVTINSKAGNLSASAQYVAMTLIKTATDVWLLIGDLGA